MNIFHKTNNRLEKIKLYIKDQTTMDFFDWGNLLLFVFGVSLIWKIFISYQHQLTINDLVQGTILWFTAIVILQYTKETYWLKQVTQKQLELDRFLGDYELMPYLRLKFNDDDGHGWYENKFLTLANDGKGIAKNIDLVIHKDQKDYKVQTIMVVGGNTGFTGIDPKHIENLSNDSNKIFKQWEQEDNDNKFGIYITGRYEDLRGEFYTVEFRYDKHDTKDRFKIINQKPENRRFGT